MGKRYTIKSDLLRKNFTNTKITFSIEHLKCESLAMVRPQIVFYTSGKTYITTYSSKWWIVGSEYQQQAHTFNINKNTLDASAWYRVQLIVDGLSPTNRLSFNHMQLCEGSEVNYHEPESTIPKTAIKFSNNFYANLYTSSEDNYLQVIRPYYNNMDTETITKSKVTVLAPHLAKEDEYDSPSNIGLEFMNASDQVIEILR